MKQGRVILLVTIIAVILICSCSNGGDRGKKNMMPELAASDSATVMYYDTPGNPRFFTMSKLYDKEQINLIAADANGKAIAPKDSCTSQGKIYFYGKGDAVYPLYFSGYKDCLTLSFIKTGEKYFTRMSDRVSQLLEEGKKTAVAPRPADQ